MTCQGPETGRTRIDDQAINDLSHRFTYRRVELPQRAADVIDAFFALADAIITVRSLICEAWTLNRWEGRPPGRP